MAILLSEHRAVLIDGLVAVVTGGARGIGLETGRQLAARGAVVAVPANAHYSVSKAGLIHLTRVLAFEWAAAGIRVNSVGPTIVATDMTADVRSDAASPRRPGAGVDQRHRGVEDVP